MRTSTHAAGADLLWRMKQDEAAADAYEREFLQRRLDKMTRA
jgi:hypothetical protein